jgi:hypothetical protein
MRELSTRRGVTLIEAVVALALGSMLLVAISGVLSSMAGMRKRSESVDSREWLYALDRILWNDLAQASSVGLDKGVLLLIVPPMRGTGKEANAVTYTLNTLADSSQSLVRTVYRSSEVSSDPLDVRTLVWGVEQISFERIDDNGVDQPLPRLLGPAPRGFHYRILRTGASPLDRQITVR